MDSFCFQNESIIGKIQYLNRPYFYSQPLGGQKSEIYLLLIMIYIEHNL